MCDSATWTGGAYNLYHLNSPNIDQMLGYDTLVLVEFLTVCFNTTCEVCEAGNHNPAFPSL